MKNTNELITHLIESGFLKNEILIDAFKTVDRKDFVLEKYRDFSYDDIPLSVGHDQTISQPAVVAFMLELLNPAKSDHILDIGSGSGWTTALLAKIAQNGKVTGVEIVDELVKFGQKNLGKYKFANVEIKKSKNDIGCPENAPYDKILVSAACKEIPEALLDQLKPGGIMVIPIYYSIYRITKKNNDQIIKEEFPGYFFVPMKE